MTTERHSLRKLSAGPRGGRPRQAVLGVLVVGLAALALGACGGGDEDEIRETVELFLARDDPRRCDVRTDRFLRNSEDEADLAAARRSCREDASEDGSIERREGSILPPEGGEVLDVEVDGDRADARVALEGGTLDGQEATYELVNEGDRWKVDLIDGEIDDRLRDRFEQGLRELIVESFRDVTAQPSRQADCTLERLRESIPNERLADYFGGRLAPGTLERTVKEAATTCLEVGARGLIEGTGYAVTVPDDWVNATAGAARRFRSEVNRLGAHRVRVDLVVVDPSEQSGANVLVTRERLPAGITLRQYYEIVRRRYDLRSDRDRMTLGGVEALQYDITGSEIGVPGDRTRQIVALRDRVAYIISFGAHENRFDDSAAVFDAILSSWQWEGRASDEGGDAMERASGNRLRARV